MSLFTGSYRALFTVATLWVSTLQPAIAGVSNGAPRGFERAIPERVLYSFQGAGDGAKPRAQLLSDGHGGFYGTTESGGTAACEGGCGTVFHLSLSQGGRFTESLVHEFGNGTDGANPEAGLIADARGTLYGTTVGGGNACFMGCGTVFELTPKAGGGFNESVIYAFTGGSDGTNPRASLLLGANGTLVGTAFGGSLNRGVVFQLTPSGGTYAENVLYAFGSQSGDGSNPLGPVIADARGNLYGLDDNGGASFGTAYRLTPTAHGYRESTLYTFSGGRDGALPGGTLAFGPHGTLYGSTLAGGESNNGTIFSLTPQAKGAYAERSIHPFTTVGAEPFAGVYVDAAGTLYGTTGFGGLPGCVNGGGCGIVFSLTPTNGGFTYEILHVFGGGRDASAPEAELIPGPGGSLYGTSSVGGTANEGTVFRIK